MGGSCSRRDVLARGLYGIGLGATLPLVLARTSAALMAQARQGTSVEGGTAQHISKGAWIMVPENTPHSFTRLATRSPYVRL